MLGTLGDLAQRVGGRVIGDAGLAVARIAGVEEATGDALTFATDAKYLAHALRSRAAAVLVDASIAPERAEKPLIVVENARAALATLLQALRPLPPRGPFVHATAVVEDGAALESDVYIGAHAYVGADARIGRASVVDTGSYVGANAAIGAHCWLKPRASVMEGCILGDRVVLHSGSVIGSEGFGWAFVGDRLERIAQIGNVVLDDDVEIGANTCVDRAQTGSTQIGRGTKIDNLCQIGHNCRIGSNSVFAALCGLAGTTIVGDGVKVGGQTGFKGHVTVGSRVTVAGGSQVWNDIPDGAFVSGGPARDHREHLKLEVLIRNLPKLVARVDALDGGSRAPRS